MRVVRMVLSLLLLTAVFGCGDKNNNVGQVDSGRILITPDPIAFSQVPIGASEEIPIIISNLEADPLQVFEVNLAPRDGGSTAGLELVDLPETPFEIAGESDVIFSMRYTPAVGQPTVRAKIDFISSDDRFTREDPKTVNIDALGNAPRLEVVPGTVRFARLPPGERSEQRVVLRNVGSAPLKIWEEPAYGGGEDFRMEVDPAAYPLELKIFDADAAQDNPQDYELGMIVDYAPLGNGADSGEIVVISNDPSGDIETEAAGVLRATHVIDVKANADAPCILVDGTTRNFGQVPIGNAAADIVTVSNCGTQPLEISDIIVTANSDDDEFEIDLRSWDANRDGRLDNTVTLRPNEEGEFFIKYTPVQVGSDQGVITIFSNDPVQRELELNLIGRGSEGICPVAQAGAFIRGVNSTPRQSLSAAPLQYIVLDGSSSFDEDGRVVDYIWRVMSQPAGSAVSLGPTREDTQDTDMSKREFRLLVAGEYVFELRVRDNEGFESCDEPATVVVRAIPNEKIHVELTWTNPEDPDESDDVGSDVDLHLVKMGPGRWFETPYDVYFRNPNNSAGAENNGLWNPESPSLDIDDRDGGGPENIQMNDPSNCEWYAVGVHYYRQLFGTAYATVRIYINAQLVYESINHPLTVGGQFWDVARIHWDTGQVYDFNQVYSAEPAGASPEVSGQMQSSGLCTAQDLYSVQ